MDSSEPNRPEGSSTEQEGSEKGPAAAFTPRKQSRPSSSSSQQPPLGEENGANAGSLDSLEKVLTRSASLPPLCYHISQNVIDSPMPITLQAFPAFSVHVRVSSTSRMHTMRMAQRHYLIHALFMAVRSNPPCNAQPGL